MLCLGFAPPPFLVLLSDLFDRLYPVGLIVAIAALGIAVVFPKYNHAGSAGIPAGEAPATPAHPYKPGLQL